MIRALAVRSAREALRSKGFEQSERVRDHEMYFLVIAGEITDFFVKLSLGATEIRRDEIRNNARQIGVKGDDLYKILACDHDKAKTEQLALQRDRH